MTTQQKISIARKLNKKYNSPRKSFESLKELWIEIESECRTTGINPDLILITRETFELLADKPKVIGRYFYEAEK